MRKIIQRVSYVKLVLASFVVGILASLLAESLKKITEYTESHLFEQANYSPYLFIVLPTIGITLIYFLRKYVFKGKKNKGIKEIYQTLENRKNELPAYKIPSHYFNGFLTVIFGGATGIEVSTVVATAAIGAAAHKNKATVNSYKTELVSAGVAAGIATLFGSPIAGFFFGVEVIARKTSKTIAISCISSTLISWLFMYFLDGKKLFNSSVSHWALNALPFFVFLSVLSGILAVYFTKITLSIKAWFSGINNNFIRVNLGAILVGSLIFIFPELYGDSYHAFPVLLSKMSAPLFSLGTVFFLFAIVMLKPFVASLTLGAGGDGGVFAPSIFAGAVLGILVAIVCNHYFHTHLIILNFALVGAAATLSAAIHAPLTSIFLTCSVVNGGYILLVPIIIGSFIAKYVAQLACSYTVYSYKGG